MKREFGNRLLGLTPSAQFARHDSRIRWRHVPSNPVMALGPFAEVTRSGLTASTPTIYSHVVNRGALGVQSLVDRSLSRGG